ncbi:MAG: EAL domain-containing protein [Epsilonproteobacteria bacterium]|nr:EAL domain-containing protein [Campylobacterota bacterium]
MKNILYDIRRFNILRGRRILRRLYRLTPIAVILMFIISTYITYFTLREIENSIEVMVWFTTVNSMNLIFLYEYLFYKFHYQKKIEEGYSRAKRRLELKRRKLTSILSQVPIGIFYYDNSLRILNYNRIFYQLFGLEGSLKGFDLHNIPDKKAVEIMESVLKERNSKSHTGSYNFLFQNKRIWAELRCSALLDDVGRVVGGIGIVEDKTSEKRAYEQINYISLHDPLTGLPNRRCYKKYMGMVLTNPKNRDHYSILFYMDLNNFKQINDTFGHTVGDKLLLEVAKRFQSLDIGESHLSRLGGDEFTLTLPFASREREDTERRALDVADKIKSLFNEMFEIEGLNLYITCSIGIVVVEPDTDNIDIIIRRADMAMYQTKREGQNNIKFYDQTLDLERQQLTALQHDLNHAIDKGELELHYQPIVSIRDNRLNAIEALIRWNHPEKGLILPDKFIPMATESGLINRIGWKVTDEVCRQLSTWSSKSLINFEYIAININARQLHEVDFAKHIERCILRYNIEPSLIKLEVTETTLIDNFNKTQKIIQELKNIGIECNIDDFGTGYSSLSYLKKLAFKVLKIDRVFISEILTNQDNFELVKSIIRIGQQFKYNIIIEGIETIEQKRKILEITDSVSYQGFLFSKAVPASELELKFLNSVVKG